MKCPSCGADNIAGIDLCESCETSLASLDGITIPKSGIGKILMRDPLSKLSPREAVCVKEDDSVFDTVKRMNLMKHGCAIVEDDQGELMGIVTERDILFRLSIKSSVSELTKIKVAEVMTYNVEALKEEDTLAYALNQMSVKRCRHIPVLRKKYKPGILSARDVLKYIAKHLED